jgi:hypothetical protein
MRDLRLARCLRHLADRAACCLIASALVVAPGRSGTRMHPLHTTITTITYDGTSHQATVTVRVFANDLDTAIARRPHGRSPVSSRSSNADSFAYLASVFTAVGPDGRALSVQWCGSRLTGDLLWACLRLATPRGLSGVRIRNQALVELFDDQVNVVMAEYDGRRESLLFTKGDAAKPLP